MLNQRLARLEKEWLPEANISDMQQKMEEGSLTSSELAQMYIHRIAVYDCGKINSVAEINPDALFIAEALDRERTVSGPRGPLHGIPILIKDNIDTADKMQTTAGSAAMAGSFAVKDAAAAASLRRAGAVILGKTNMTEWANFMADSMPSGYSSLAGQVLNPYGDFDAGGSSSGSGAAAAANFAAAAVGTETSGSILNPSSQNALAGIKPTVGLISRSGIIPISHTQDTAGPMARTVSDAAILLNALAGPDAQDPATLTAPERTDYTSVLRPDGLKGARIGVAGSPFFDSLDGDELLLMEKAIQTIRNLGAEVIEDIAFESMESEGFTILLHEFKNGINAYLSAAPGFPHSLSDVIAYNKEHAGRMLKYGQSVLEQAEATSGRLVEEAYLSALQKCRLTSREMGIDKAMSDHSLDAVVFPGDSGSVLCAQAGYPTVIVPAGFRTSGEPIGISFSGGAFTEAKLISYAYSFEQASLCRKAPSLTYSSLASKADIT